MVAHLNRRHVLSLTAGVTAASACGLVVSTNIAHAIEPKGTINMEKVLVPGQWKDMVEGDANAPVTVVEYASLTCSHCMNFNNNTMPAIREKYIKTGKMRWVLREFPYDPLSQAGFLLARCLPEDRYFPFIQVMFEKYSEWVVQDPIEPLKKIAGMAGLDEAAFNSCLTDQSAVDKLNSSTKRGTDEFGVTGTPTFFINGEIYVGEMSVEEMSAIIDKFLK